MSLSGKWSAGLWLACALWVFGGTESLAADASPAASADAAAWGVYAELAGKTWTGEHGSVGWAWAADGTLVQSDAGSTSVIRRGERPGQLIQESGRLYTFDGYIAADGAVMWLRRGPIKSPLRISLKDGRVVAESVKVDDAKQVVDVGRVRTYGPGTPARPVPAPAAGTAVTAATAIVPATPAASPATATVPAAPAVSPAGTGASAPRSASAAPAAPKSGPRTLSEADLAALRQRIQGDKARRAQALSQEQAAAEQLRQQMEQIQQMAAIEEEAWDEEPAAPAPNLAEVFLTTLGNEMAKNQAEREAQDAFIRDIERQQAAALERRQREEQRQRAAAERARQAQYASAPAPTMAPAVPDAAAQARQAQAAARDRELAAQAAAERLRQQQLRTQRQAAAPAAGTAGGATAEAAAKPLRFVMSIGLLNKPGDTVNPTCYSNVITRPGPPGWGAPGFLPPGSGEQARAAVYALKDAFIARCRASGREITSEGNFNYVWNQTSSDEQTLQGARPRFREDVAVSL